MNPTAEKLATFGLDPQTAADLAGRIENAQQIAPELAWQEISQRILLPDHPFELHTLVFTELFRNWNSAFGPPPAWLPTDADRERANVTALRRRLGLHSFSELHAWSVENRELYWTEALNDLALHFETPPRSILDLSEGVEHSHWLVGARLNIADSCFLGHSDMPAIISGSEDGTSRCMSVGALHALTGRVANALVNQGFRPGDAIAIIMPMTIEAVAAYLGVIRAGCVAVSIADSFAPPEISARLEISSAKAIVCQDILLRLGRSLPLYEHLPGSLKKIVVQTTEATHLLPGDLWWHDFLADETAFISVLATPTDTINLLFSSGTTGTPKAIPWSHSTPIKCATDGRYHHDIHAGDVVSWPTNLGWMMGPWLVFASLLNRATIALFDGAPSTRAFGEFVSSAKVNILGVIPSLVRAWKDSSVLKGVDWSAIRCFSSTGEVSHPSDMLYCMSLAGYRPVIEYCGGTEIGGGYLTGSTVQPSSPGTFSTPALGTAFEVLDETGRPCRNGEVFLLPPSIGWSSLLLNGDHHQTYFCGTPVGQNGTTLRRHGDHVECLPAGYFRVHGRTDDTMNLGGIKVSTAEIEEALQAVSGLKETAAIGIPPSEGGPLKLVIYAVRNAGRPYMRDELLSAVRLAVKTHLNPLFKVHDLVLVAALPRTASNKIMRRRLRDHYIAPAKNSSIQVIE